MVFLLVSFEKSKTKLKTKVFPIVFKKYGYPYLECKSIYVSTHTGIKLLDQIFDLINLISSFVYTTVKTWSINYSGILITSPSHLQKGTTQQKETRVKIE